MLPGRDAAMVKQLQAFLLGMLEQGVDDLTVKEVTKRGVDACGLQDRDVGGIVLLVVVVVVSCVVCVSGWLCPCVCVLWEGQLDPDTQMRCSAHAVWRSSRRSRTRGGGRANWKRGRFPGAYEGR